MIKLKQNKFLYRITQLAAGTVSKIYFKPKCLRNEIKGKKGPFVVIANHEAALDFINLIGVTSVPMHFVISHSFFSTIPVKSIMEKTGMIDKQQFQTSVRDISRMKAVIDQDRILAFYPAGLMSEDGRSTPIPIATAQFIKWLGADVYVARTSGSYFVMPKWRHGGFRKGRTFMDVYRLFTKDELTSIDDDELNARITSALSFDAYREQEQLRIRYRGGDNIEGLEDVLYACPSCKSEYTVKVRNKNTIYCEHCGFEQTSDEYGFMHNEKSPEKEIRYPSDWSAMIYSELYDRIASGERIELSSRAKIHTIDYKKKKFVEVGEGDVTFSPEGLHLRGTVSGEERDIIVSASSFPSLPFKPGAYLELQHGKEIFRLYLEDGRRVMKFINFVKINYELCEPEHREHLHIADHATEV